MSDTKDLAQYTAEQAREVGLPTPQAVQYMMSIANMLLTSALITPDMEPPKEALSALRAAGWQQPAIDQYRDDVIRSNAMAKMLIGREMHMEAMESLQDIDIVKGKIFVRYPQLIGQMIKKGFTVKWIERTHERAAMEVVRPDVGMELFEFTIEDAKRAGALAGDARYNQYVIRPRVMLSARVASEAYRMTGGRSTVYTPEEKSEVLGTRSTMDEPSLEDRKRAEVLENKENGGMGDFKVGLKVPKEDPDPDPDARQAAPIEVKPEPPAAPVVQWWICLAVKKGDGTDSFVPVDGEQPQNTLETASLRARAMSTDKHLTYVVMRTVDGKLNGDNPVAAHNPPTTQPKANGAPAPAAQQTTSAPADPNPPVSIDKGKREVLMARLGELAPLLTDEHGKPIASKTAGARFNSFFAGWFGVPIKELPKDPALYPAPMEALEGVLVQDVNEFRAGPEQCGKSCRSRYTDLQAYMEKQWPKNPETVLLGHRLCCQWNKSFDHFKAWFEQEGIEGAKGLDFMAQADGHALLRMALKSREACLLLKFSVKHNLSIAKIAEQIETRGLKCSIEEADAPRVTAAVQGFMQAIIDETRRPAAPMVPELEPTKDPEPAEEEEDGGLFSDL
jgi:hypothetical protein